MAYSVEFKGFSGVMANMKNVNARHVPFVMSRTVNGLAYKIQRDTIDRLLPEKFMLRTDWWRPGRKTGVNYFPSNKRQTPIKAKVNTLAWFMERQETGGIKKPRPGDPYVAIPTWNAQPNKHEVIRPNRRHRALVQGKKASRMTLAHQGNPWISTLKNGRPSIAVRLTTARLPVAVMYIGKNSVTIKPRFGFKVNGQRICDTHFKEIFDREWANAISTETKK
jgi:hypothetical protein